MEEMETGFYKQLFAEDELYLINVKQELKNICIVLDKKLNAKNENFLSKILSAVKLSLYNTSILYSENVDKASALETNVVLIFDNDSKENYDKYQSVKDGNSTILQCDSLDLIASDKALKGKLWVALQNIFLK